jgi:hypothetical protein
MGVLDVSSALVWEPLAERVVAELRGIGTDAEGDGAVADKPMMRMQTTGAKLAPTPSFAAAAGESDGANFRLQVAWDAAEPEVLFMPDMA